MQRTTPSRLTEIATRKLSRTALLVVGVLYIFAGLFYRDPWKTDDLTGLATMLTAFRGQEHAWLLPQIGNYAYAQEGPLLTWIGTLFIQVFSPVFMLFQAPLEAQITAARLPIFIYFFVIIWATWYGTYLLARRKECQPLALPFGGEPNPQDYGRMIADAAVLFIIATIGIVIRMHETSNFPLIMMCQAVAFYGMARMLDHPVQGSTLAGLGLGAAFLTRGAIGGVPVLLALIALLFFRNFGRQQKLWLLWSVALAAACCLVWLAAANNTSSYWANSYIFWNNSLFSLPSPTEIFSTLRDLSWFLWPTWPFMIIALWNWRKWMDAPHIFIPALLLGAAVLTVVFQKDAFESEYAMLAVPCAILASLSLPTLRRSFVNTLDWFSIMIMSLAMVATWLGWVALNFGWPPKIHHNITRLLTGFEPHISAITLILALVVCLAWIWTVSWRLRSNPAVLWRGIVLSATGLTLTWMLLALLWLPSINYNRSYKAVSEELATVIDENNIPADCIRQHGVGLGQRAAFYVFEGLQFSFDAQCQYVLLQTTFEKIEDEAEPYPDNATLIWQGKRRPDRHEVFRLIQLPAR
ncbi:4-amino-4-deoxy-L-arabinose transferase-like glycosyltransferase [Advenella incenata]|uniref:4-amino-4-deoxy-L-arabinose transferase-like glycosyltransferase n=1 Tax=Advenella incenata TaxID=267800 RepID=A0A4Q7VUD5_9BURK|nr:glycosyltransferase [Advenella incenata]RZU00035.1 4-amino-4-deoxy-L-arabinose transferase-like glycosyltransferase [Advenella incenata]